MKFQQQISMHDTVNIHDTLCQEQSPILKLRRRSKYPWYSGVMYLQY